jgi:ParB family chromosome partitioning protein
MTDILIDLVNPNPKQPRKHFDEAMLTELAESIKQVGLLNPILVRPIGERFEIVHGERRWRACKLAGIETIRAEIRELDDETAFIIGFAENLQRDDLNPIEEAQAIKTMIDLFNYSQAEVAAKLGKSQPWISGRLALLKLPDPVQEKVITRVISASTARELSRIEKPEIQAELVKKAENGNLTVRELEAIKSNPDDWPPPATMLAKGGKSFFHIMKWAERRLAYLDSNPQNSRSMWIPSKHKTTTDRATIELCLEWSAGRHLNIINRIYKGKTFELILDKAGALGLSIEHMVRYGHPVPNTRHWPLSEKNLVDFPDYPWNKDLLVSVNWIDKKGNINPLFAKHFWLMSYLMLNLFCIALWSNSDAYPHEIDNRRRALDEARACQKAKVPQGLEILESVNA